MRRHRLLAGVLILGAALIALGGTPILAEAASIGGRLINKTPGGKGVDGVEVTLTLHRNDQEAGKTQATTDRTGRFQFLDLSSRPGDTYTVTVRYQGAEYNTDRVILENAGATQTLEIPVYDSTTDASRISVKVHHVLFAVGDGTLEGKEVLLFRNAGDKAYIGAKEVSGGRRATLQFSLPSGAREVRYGQGLMECCIVPGEQGFVDTMDVKPGERQVAFSYTLTPTGGGVQFVRPVDYLTEAVEVFIPESGLQISSEGLKPAGVVSGEKQPFLRYSGTSLEVPAAIALTINNLPAIGGRWRPYAYASVGILLLAGVTYPFVRRRRPVVPRSSPGRSITPPQMVPQGRTEIALRKVELVAALAELEASHDAGRIAEKEYRRLRQEKRKALRDVLARLQEDPAMTAAPSTT
ncbi:MAG TPA: carboxypeptidase-like regulatory domain-containing protein [Candidatus Methylomirabilis sp.]|nr:carboxypeptidase-like regulatory domain-containing protein [Candidatus Methylomirabilis sp.]HSC71468.1 carboxypeptidase-like regulatory domain-containing protein [Candidatus Methylomirabilis sp.]